MRLSVMIGEDQSGRWTPIALPDKSIDEQKKTFKQIKINHGLYENGKKPIHFKRVMYFDAYAKRAFFDVVMNKPSDPPTINA